MCKKVMFLFIWDYYLNVGSNSTSVVQFMAKVLVMAYRGEYKEICISFQLTTFFKISHTHPSSFIPVGKE